MLTVCFLCVTSIDSSLGKIDKHSLSQQTLMELFIQSFSRREKICGISEDPVDISKWNDLTFNDKGEVTGILWGYKYLEGSLELKWLPPTTRECNVSWNKLDGLVDLTCLPDGLKILYMSNNHFVGPIDLTSLPDKIEKLLIYGNDFTGITDFTKLPDSLRELDVSYNKDLEGEVLHFDGALCSEFSNVRDMRKK